MSDDEASSEYRGYSDEENSDKEESDYDEEEEEEEEEPQVPHAGLKIPEAMYEMDRPPSVPEALWNATDPQKIAKELKDFSRKIDRLNKEDWHDNYEDISAESGGFFYTLCQRLSSADSLLMGHKAGGKRAYAAVLAAADSLHHIMANNTRCSIQTDFDEGPEGEITLIGEELPSEVRIGPPEPAKTGPPRRTKSDSYIQYAKISTKGLMTAHNPQAALRVMFARVMIGGIHVGLPEGYLLRACADGVQHVGMGACHVEGAGRYLPKGMEGAAKSAVAFFAGRKDDYAALTSALCTYAPRHGVDVRFQKRRRLEATRDVGCWAKNCFEGLLKG